MIADDGVQANFLRKERFMAQKRLGAFCNIFKCQLFRYKSNSCFFAAKKQICFVIFTCKQASKSTFCIDSRNCICLMDRFELAKIFYIRCHNPKGMQSLALPAKCVQRNQTADKAAVHVARTSANVTLI